MDKIIELLENKNFNELTYKEKMIITSIIEKNNKEELKAIEDYYKLLAIIPIEFKKDIEDIISDELNHSIILSKIVESITHIYTSEYESFNSIKKKGV